MALDSTALQRRGEVARRLKAARWLLGGVRPAEDGKGKTGFEVHALAISDLAARATLSENQMTASKLGSIERMERHTTPMELTVIAEALGLGAEWFSTLGERAAFSPSDLRDVLQRVLDELDRAERQGQPGTEPGEADEDHPDEGQGDGGA